MHRRCNDIIAVGDTIFKQTVIVASFLATITKKDKGIFMKQYEYFAADYRTGKKQLKRDFARDTVALFENENATLNDMREGRKALKAKYKADKRTLKKESKRLEKDFRKDFGMFRRPIMADIFDFFEEARAVPNGRTPFNDEIKIEKI